MANYKDYIKVLDLDDGDPEGSGGVTLGLSVSGSGTDGNYGNFALPSLGLLATGENISRGEVLFPSLIINGHANNYAELIFPMLSLEATRGNSVFGDCQITFRLVSDGNETPPLGGDIDLPMLELEAFGGPRLKVYQLCDNENWGL